MSEYLPDGWVIIKLGNGRYKVFGSWSGGYLGSDHWRINSGIERYAEDETCFYFYGNSGSVYVCSKVSENRLNMYTYGILNIMLEGNADASVVDSTDFLKEFKND